MKRAPIILVLLSSLLALHGCVVVVGTDSDDGVYWADRDDFIDGIGHDGERLSRKVAEALAADADLAVRDLRVVSDDGEVVLKGRADSVDTLARALQTAEAVDGVERVVSKIIVDAG